MLNISILSYSSSSAWISAPEILRCQNNCSSYLGLLSILYSFAFTERFSHLALACKAVHLFHWCLMQELYVICVIRGIMPSNKNRNYQNISTKNIYQVISCIQLAHLNIWKKNFENIFSKKILFNISHFRTLLKMMIWMKGQMMMRWESVDKWLWCEQALQWW